MVQLGSVQYSSAMTELPQLEGRVAIVSGGSRGIGFCIAKALVSRGSRVAIFGLNQARLSLASERLRQMAPKDFGPVIASVTDIRMADQVQSFVDDVVKKFGGLDILINNAGIRGFAEAAEQPVSNWHRIIDTNLKGVFHCCRAAIPHLQRRGSGWIINVSSLAGRHPFPGGSAYCASKAGLNAFSEVLMQELRSHNIRVSCVSPGSVDTDFSGTTTNGDTSWKLNPDDVAQAVVDLLGHEQRSLPSLVELRPSKPRR